MMKILVRYLFLLAACFSTEAYAFASLGDVSANILGPLGQLTQLLHAVCSIAGLSFLFAGLMQIKTHRDNPQQVKISTPITSLLLGLALLALPSFAMLSESGFFVS
jgi:hypothetical protein